MMALQRPAPSPWLPITDLFVRQSVFLLSTTHRTKSEEAFQVLSLSTTIYDYYVDWLTVAVYFYCDL